MLLGKNLFELWEEGAQDIEKTAPGRIVTAPVRIIESATGTANKIVTSTGKVAEAAPGIAKMLPLILIILAGGVGAYLLFAGKSGVNLVPKVPGVGSPELMGGLGTCGRKQRKRRNKR